MMRLWQVVLVLAVGTAPLAYASAGESPLAAAARKEQERRAKAKGAEKVITNDDLPPSVAAAPPAEVEAGADAEATPPGDDAQTGAAAGKPAGDEQKEARRAAIQAEIDAQVERIRVVRKQIDDIDRELADQVAVSEGPRRAQIAQQRAEGTQFIAGVEARLAELQDEARKLGVTVTRPE